MGAEAEFGISFRLNGRDVVAKCPPTTPLVSVLRDHFALKGVKLSCSRAVCGSCVVLVDGLPGASCSMFAFQVEGAEVLTVEGLVTDGKPHPIQAAFAANTAFQCGYCTAGMIMLTKSLLDRVPRPDRETVRSWLSSNVCRCTGYEMIIDAVIAASRSLAIEARDGEGAHR